MNSITNSLLMSIPTAILHTVVIPYLSPMETEKLCAVSRSFRSSICANETLWQQKVIYQVGAEKVKRYLKLYERFEKSWYKLSIAFRMTALVVNSNGELEQGEFRNGKLHGLGKRSKFDRTGNFRYKEEGRFINGDPEGIFTRTYPDGKVKKVRYKDGEYQETVKLIFDSRRNRCLIM